MVSAIGGVAQKGKGAALVPAGLAWLDRHVEGENAVRTLWLILGVAFLALGLAGVVLPVVPTTPFLLLAAGCFAKSSPRLHGWLLAHPTLGPPIRRWEEHGAIAPGAKRLAVGSMVAVFGLSLALGLGWKVLLAQGVLITIGCAFILTRPSGPLR